MRAPVPLPRPAQFAGLLGGPRPLPTSLPTIPAPLPRYARPGGYAGKDVAGEVGLLGGMFGWGDNPLYQGIRRNNNMLLSLGASMMSGDMSNMPYYLMQGASADRDENREFEAERKSAASRESLAKTVSGWGAEYRDLADGIYSGAIDVGDGFNAALRMRQDYKTQADDRALRERNAHFLQDPEVRDAYLNGGFKDFKEAYDYERGSVPQYRPVTDEEAAAYGLPSPDGYQMDAKGNIDKIGGGGTTVNVSPGESAYQKEVGGGFGKQYVAIQEGAQNGVKALTTLGMMEQAIADPSFYSGTLAESAVLPLKRAAAAVGIDPNGVTSMESFNALSKQAALDVMGGSLGTGFSNADRDFVIQQVPNLQNTPEGNVQLIQIQKALAQRQIEISQLADMYAAENAGQIDGGFYQFLAQWAEENPLFVGGAGAAGATGGALTLPDPLGMRSDLR